MHTIEKCRIGAMNIIYTHHSLDYMLDSFERIGIHQFELWAPCSHFDLRMPMLGDIQAFRKKVYGRGFRIVCVTPDQCAYPYNIAAADKDVRQVAIAHFNAYMDATAELGVSQMLCGAGWGDVDGDKEEAWNRSMDSLGQMIDHAEKVGIDLAFEILNEYESDLVHDLSGMERVARQFDSPRLKFCVDTVPVELEGRTLADYFESSLGRRISHIHMTDGAPLGHVPPGLGQHDMARYFKTLSDYHYDGNITIEICDTIWSNEPEKATRIGYEHLCSALEKSKKM